MASVLRRTIAGKRDIELKLKLLYGAESKSHIMCCVMANSLLANEEQRRLLIRRDRAGKVLGSDQVQDKFENAFVRALRAEACLSDDYLTIICEQHCAFGMLRAAFARHMYSQEEAAQTCTCRGA